MRTLSALLLTLAALACTAGAALACHVGGYVYCDATGLPLSGIRVDVTANDGTSYTTYAVSNDLGRYDIPLLCEPHCYTLTASIGPDEAIVTPTSGSYSFCADASNNYIVERDWVVSSPSCSNEGCWLTGGGAKFSSITGTTVGDYTKAHNWGGNVNPACSPTAGDGGSWNDIDNVNRLHFHGTHVEVIRCGNVDGIPPGSTSPVTPFNYIEFQGSGTLKGIKGNKVDFGTVYFWARAEDRNEPGSNGQRDGAGKDRYFLNVFTNPADPAGSSVLLVDVDGNPATMDPVTITDGNMQIHISSCDATTTTALRAAPSSEGVSDAKGVAWLGVPYPNPGRTLSTLRFGLPKATSVSLRVFDAAGRLVRELENGLLPAGEYASTWDLRGTRGDRVAAGVYFVRMALGSQVISRVVTVAP
jgi:hypothetical protein